MSGKISRDEMRRRVEEEQGGRGTGEQGREEGDEQGQDTDGGAPVRVTMWQGLANYECGFCAYATLDAEAMAGHLRAVHGWVELQVTSDELRVKSEEAAEAVVD